MQQKQVAAKQAAQISTAKTQTITEDGPGDRFRLAQPGEKLVDIALEFGVKPQDIAKDNNIALNGPRDYVFSQQTGLIIKNVPTAKQAELAVEDAAFYDKYAEAETAEKFGAFITELYRSTGKAMPQAVRDNLKNPTELLAMMSIGAGATYALKKGGVAGKVVKVLGAGFLAFDAGRLAAIMKNIAFNCETKNDAKEYAKAISGNGVASAQFMLDILAAGVGAAGTAKVMNVRAARTAEAAKVVEEAKAAEAPRIVEAEAELNSFKNTLEKNADDYKIKNELTDSILPKDERQTILDESIFLDRGADYYLNNQGNTPDSFRLLLADFYESTGNVNFINCDYKPLKFFCKIKLEDLLSVTKKTIRVTDVSSSSEHPTYGNFYTQKDILTRIQAMQNYLSTMNLRFGMTDAEIQTWIATGQ